MSFIDILRSKSDEFGISLSAAQCEAIDLFYRTLIDVNQSINLTAITEPEDVAVKHIIDSLSCYHKKYFYPNAKVVDVGTGAGFPGIPLAIYDSNIEITLFDSLQKRLRFLEKVSTLIGLNNVNFLHGRAEDMAHQHIYRETFDVGTSRAVARLPILLEWGLPYIKKGGVFIALKGAAYESEIKESTRALQILGGKVVECVPVVLPGLNDKRAIIYIEKINHTPQLYPRKPKEIKDKPL